MDPCTITRTTLLDLPTEVAWAWIATPSGLARWLGTDLTMAGDGSALVAGTAGTVRDEDGARRRLVVTEVVAGERLAFTWWRDEEPEVASAVVVTLQAEGEGSRVSVSETIDPVALGALSGRASVMATAEVTDVAGAGAGWDRRLADLVGQHRSSLVAAVW